MAYKNTVGYIADAFSTAFRSKQEQMQREREFNQRMAEEQRQSSLLDYWKQKNYEVDKLRAETDNTYKNALIDNMNVPKIEKPVESLLGSFNKNGVMVDKYGYIKDGKEIITDQKYHNIPKDDGSDKPWQPPKNFFDLKSKLLNPDTEQTIRYKNENNENVTEKVPVKKYESELNQNKAQIEGALLQSMPVNALNFFNNNLKDRNIGVRSALSLAIQARQNGQLSDQDLDALTFYYQQAQEIDGANTSANVLKRITR